MSCFSIDTPGSRPSAALYQCKPDATAACEITIVIASTLVGLKHPNFQIFQKRTQGDQNRYPSR